MIRRIPGDRIAVNMPILYCIAVRFASTVDAFCAALDTDVDSDDYDSR